jgi:hypothetical protein
LAKAVRHAAQALCFLSFLCLRFLPIYLFPFLSRGQEKQKDTRCLYPYPNKNQKSSLILMLIYDFVNGPLQPRYFYFVRAKKLQRCKYYRHPK